MDSDKTILEKVTERIRARIDSLRGLSMFNQRGLGLEGWFKVEVINALGCSVIEVKNRGADLVIDINGKKRKVELKAHNMRSWSGIDFGIKQSKEVDICLFLKRKNNEDKENKKVEKLRDEGFETFVNDINNEWIVGIIRRKG